MREVAGKEWFIDCHVLERHDPSTGLDLNDAIDQQEWISVRQNRRNR